MSYRDHINSDKFKQLQKSVYDNAVAHGWHEKPLSKAHHMGMIITEVAEAVEASGYKYVICRSVDDFIEQINAYLR